MIAELQEAMLKLPQAEIKTTHSFCDGVYAREITIPKGVCLVGAKHKTAFFMVISKGTCLIHDNDKEVRVTAPKTIQSKVGAKRVMLALEETVLTTFHPTKETNIKKIELEIIEDEGLSIANNKTIDELDHESFLNEYGITKQHENKVLEYTKDMDFKKIANLKIGDSNISGKGMFTEKTFKIGEVVAICNKCGMRTLAGRYTNHSKTPNCTPKHINGNINFMAIKNISKGEEITINYRDSIKSVKEFLL